MAYTRPSGDLLFPRFTGCAGTPRAGQQREPLFTPGIQPCHNRTARTTLMSTLMPIFTLDDTEPPGVSWMVAGDVRPPLGDGHLPESCW